MKIKIGKGDLNAACLASLTGGELFGDGEQSFGYICTDSREADADTLFVAIRGERVDGHDYIPAAVGLGCRCVLCERAVDGVTCVTVADSVASLSDLARGYGYNDPRKTVAITGSVGKTTTKEMIAAALKTLYPYKTCGNYNSVIGSPLSMLEMDGTETVAVLEMGMSGRGEIEKMSHAARPDIAVITNIGSSHLEMLGSRENIREAKLEILSGMKEDGTLLLNGDDTMLCNLKLDVHTARVSLRDESCEFFAGDIESDGFGVSFTANYPDKSRQTVRLNVLGEHNVQAAMFGLAAAYLLGVDSETAAEGLACFENTGMRQNIYELADMTVVEDCYNASPESMRAAIRVAVDLSKHIGGRTVAVLGDMKELGGDSQQMHRATGRFAAECGVDLLICYGELAKDIAKGAEDLLGIEVLCLAADPEATATVLVEKLKSKDVLLFKASRAMALESVIRILKERTV